MDERGRILNEDIEDDEKSMKYSRGWGQERHARDKMDRKDETQAGDRRE